jgi:hypothetical protein
LLLVDRRTASAFTPLVDSFLCAHRSTIHHRYRQCLDPTITLFLFDTTGEDYLSHDPTLAAACRGYGDAFRLRGTMVISVAACAVLRAA